MGRTKGAVIHSWHPLVQHRRFWLQCVFTAFVSVLLSCAPKVPIRDVGAQFYIADAVWFEEEETLFFFYRVEATQGLNETSRIEIALDTDDAQMPFTSIQSFAPVHEHQTVDCEWNLRCGSWSIHMPNRPRNVRMRLRYHQDGDTFLASELGFFQVDAGPDHRNRSAVLYGVFDEQNRRIQWRLRHQFPNLRNEEIESLGLRRAFRVSDLTYGNLNAAGQPLASNDTQPAVYPSFFDENPYGYGFGGACPSAFRQVPGRELMTQERAVFDAEPLPIEASSWPYACATTEVLDGTGWYRTATWAQKNPEVEPAFSSLRTPIQPLREIRYFFDFCSQEDNTGHREMQLQRLLMGPEDVFCIDGESRESLEDRFRQELSERIDRERRADEDLVLYAGLHRGREQEWAARSLEQALAGIFQVELGRSTPRLAGAFVFDSEPYSVREANVELTTLWCPGFPALNLGNDRVQVPSSCSTTLVEVPTLSVRNVSFASLPILPSRQKFDLYAEQFGTEYLGSVKSLAARAPKRIAESENVQVGPFSIATYFADEQISAGPEVSFSFCINEESVAQNLVFRSLLDGESRDLASMPSWHNENRETAYDIGLLWDSSFYLEVRYGTFAVAQPEQQNVTFLDEELNLTVTVPLGPEIPGEFYPFESQWTEDSFNLANTLVRCNRFCNHPTFDSVGIYQVRQSFRNTYQNACYAPAFPVLWEGGFPLDP